MNPLIQGHSGTVPETSWNAFATNKGTNEDNSLSDAHLEASIFRSQRTQNFGPEVGHESVGASRNSVSVPEAGALQLPSLGNLKNF